MDTIKPLTVQDIRSGVAAAIECRRIMAWHGAQLGGLMLGLGLLLVGAGYFAQGQVSPWAWLLPAVLLAIVLPSPFRQVWRLSRLVRELEVAGHKVAAGGVVRAQDIALLGLLPAP
ncbi:hypothetical protein GCM10027191_08980 [Novilysobacter erysipheiresistens]